MLQKDDFALGLGLGIKDEFHHTHVSNLVGICKSMVDCEL